MGKPIPEGLGFRVEAFDPGEAVADRRPMLYSAEALKTIESIRERLGQVLKQHALDLAKRNGRNLVTDDDVWEALDSIDIADIFADFDEEAGDER
jgi:hypothetical protein